MNQKKRTKPGHPFFTKKQIFWAIIFLIFIIGIVFTQFQIGEWSNPITIYSDNIYMHDIDVSLDNNGTAMAVWCQDQNFMNAQGIFFSQFLKGSWKSPLRIDASNTIPEAVRILSDDYGNTLIVWVSTGMRQSTIYVRRYHNMTGWGPIKQIAQSSSRITKNNWDASINANGDAVVVFADEERVIKAIYYCNSSKKIGWLENFTISSSGICPKALMDSGGNAHIIWNNHNAELCYRGSKKSEEWEPEIKIATGSTDFRVAMNARDKIAVVWTDMGKQYDFCIKASIFNGVWSEPQVIATELNHDGMPDIALDNGGNAMVAYYRIDEQKIGRVYFTNSKGSKGWSAPHPISDEINMNAQPKLHYSIPPRIYFDKKGKPLVVWHDFNTHCLNDNRWGLVFNGWRGPRNISGAEEIYSSPLGIAGARQGKVLLIGWAEADPRGSKVEAKFLY